MWATSVLAWQISSLAFVCVCFVDYYSVSLSGVDLGQGLPCDKDQSLLHWSAGGPLRGALDRRHLDFAAPQHALRFCEGLHGWPSSFRASSDRPNICSIPPTFGTNALHNCLNVFQTQSDSPQTSSRTRKDLVDTWIHMSMSGPRQITGKKQNGLCQIFGTCWGGGSGRAEAPNIN